MANYIIQSDIEDVFGVANVAKWSNLDNTQASADISRITAAINYAQDAINNRFRGSRWSVPLTGDGSTLYQVKNWAATLAGLWLHQSRGLIEDEDKLGPLRNRVEEEMEAVLAGQRQLAAAQNYADTPTAPISVALGGA